MDNSEIHEKWTRKSRAGVYEPVRLPGDPAPAAAPAPAATPAPHPLHESVPVQPVAPAPRLGPHQPAQSLAAPVRSVRTLSPAPPAARALSPAPPAAAHPPRGMSPGRFISSVTPSSGGTGSSSSSWLRGLGQGPKPVNMITTLSSSNPTAGGSGIVAATALPAGAQHPPRPSTYKLPAYDGDALQVLMQRELLLAIPGISRPVAHAMMQQLRDAVPDKAERLNKVTARHLCTAVLLASRLLQDNRRSLAVTTIQSLVRGRRVRAKLRNTPMLRNQAIANLVRHERQYVNHLDTCLNVFVKPLRAAATSKSVILTPQDIKHIFGEYEKIYEVHKGLLEKFEEMMKPWPFITNKVGSILAQHISQFSVYQDYVTNFDFALKTLDTCHTNNDRFSLFVENAELSLKGGMSMQAFLSIPLNQINQYELLLLKIEEKTDQSRVEAGEMQDLLQMLTVMKQTADNVRTCLGESGDRAEVLSVLRRLTNTEEIEPHLSKFKKLLKEGDVTAIEGKKGDGRRLIMFPGVLISAKLSGKDQQGHTLYRFRSLLFLDNLVSAREIPDVHGFSQVIELNFDLNPVLFSTHSELEKKNWLLLFNKFLEEKRLARVFGVPLDILCQQTEIPAIFSRCVAFIQEKGMKNEGIFRLSGDKSEIQKLKTAFDSGQDFSIESITQDPNAVAGCLKMWLRELPEPLFPFSVYSPLLDTQELPPQEKLAGVSAIIKELPHSHLVCLSALLSFLSNVASFAAHNKMTSANLSIVFGPNILRPAEESIVSALRIPVANSVVQLLIDNPHIVSSALS
eukprot:TRINITY_DN5151_c0_g1_i1.p1 TRINITY_DN5151_c0_g1~~TRINITY_DN5151_c0_g1_i1.p1  ORF type:complete len:807 (+),score=217.63 TRINITY_DN5151_c0_g1_i1:35-2422(+)